MMDDRHTLPIGGESQAKLVPVRLVARVGGKEVARLVLSSGTAFVGSAPGNDLLLDHPTVSRRHVELQLRPGGVHVRDMGSTNGTRFQGSRVRELLVPPGSTLVLGEAVLSVEDEADQPLLRLGGIATKSPVMAKALEQLGRVAGTESTVLLEGETGSGKEVAARALHEASTRANGPFEIVDCGALPHDLASAELFGHVKGAFTGADRDRAGPFERALEGTVFLDEIGELPIDLQPLLLRALERREVRRVGDSTYRPVDVRIIAATNRDLAKEAQKGRFREDLLHRLAVVKVRVPPLRERKEDVPLLVRAALDSMGPRAASVSLSPETLGALANYAWPGNVRELRNLVERAVALGGGRPLDPEALGLDPTPTSMLKLDYKLAREGALEAFERDFVIHILRSCDKNVSRAAREAGIDRVYLHKLIKKHGIQVAEL